MQPMYVSIQQKETGNRIKSLLKQNGYTVKDIQGAMGFENPQAVYKWLSGRSLPSIDNFIILSRLLHTSIEDILVIDGDIVRSGDITIRIIPPVKSLLKCFDDFQNGCFCFWGAGMQFMQNFIFNRGNRIIVFFRENKIYRCI